MKNTIFLNTHQSSGDMEENKIKAAEKERS